MEKVTLEDILESVLCELGKLKSTESESSIYADAAIAGIGSTMNLIRCVHTALATGADPRRVRQFLNTHLRRTMATDAAAILELASVPNETEDSFPGTVSDFAERVVTRVYGSEARKPKESRLYEVRLMPEEAAAGCVLPLRLESGVTVNVTFPPGRKTDISASPPSTGRRSRSSPVSSRAARLQRRAAPAAVPARPHNRQPSHRRADPVRTEETTTMTMRSLGAPCPRRGANHGSRRCP
jgi:hypothetical protein